MSSGPRAVNTYSGRAVPSNYVAGLGRGAIGFTTRSDIGPARDQPAMPDMGMGGGMGAPPPQAPPAGLSAAEKTKNEADYSETQYDEEYGYGGNLFGDTPYEEDDAEADRVYEAIDERMDERRKRRREEQLLENMKKYRQERPKISDQFADLKRELGTVSEDAWESIPDVGDYSLALKQKKKAESYTPMPDSVLAGAGLGGGGPAAFAGHTSGMATPLGMAGIQTPMGGAATPFTGWGGTSSVMGGAMSGVATGGLAAARGTVLSLRLDKMSDSVTGQTVVDPKGYLTDLNSIKINSEAEVGDIKKARLLLRSVTTTNPKHGPGWIAAARVEEFAGKIVAARAVIKQGCEVCPDSEDVWLEAARLQSNDNAKTILANAVHHLPQSVKVWMQAAELETDKNRQKVVLRRALEFVPNSVKLWKRAISLEEARDARLMLGRAVECVPHCVDMWLALARLETYDNARKVLNQARQAIPTEPSIWITAAKLEEAHGHVDQVGKIVDKAVAVLTRDSVLVDRDQWLREAEAAEHAGAPHTCAALVKASIWRGVEADDRKRTWLDDAQGCLAREAPETARAVYAHALSVFPTKKGLWRAACDLERKHGTLASLEHMLSVAVQHCPSAEVLWLMWAKEKWVSHGDVPGAREVLVDAFKVNPDSEEIWLAAAKLEWENHEYERARMLLTKATTRAPSAKVWIKRALLERECAFAAAAAASGEGKEGGAAAAAAAAGGGDGGGGELGVLDEAIRAFPGCDKLYMMAGQACTRTGEVERARGYYQAGLRRCPGCLPLWQLAAGLEANGGGGKGGTRSVTRGRSLLELARLKNPKRPELWLASIRLETAAGQPKMASALMAKALRECPASGLLWAEEIASAAKPDRRNRSLEALKQCDNDARVIAAVAALFVAERKCPKARKWFDRAVKIDGSLGDVWAAYYAFELAHGDQDTQQAVLTRCVAAEPKYGDAWCAQSKDPARPRAHQTTEHVLKDVAKAYAAGGAAAAAGGGKGNNAAA